MLMIRAVFVDTGVLRKEEYDHEYDYLIKRMTVFGNFYLASAELNKQEFKEKDIEEYIEIYCLSIYPYLTAKGKKLYRNLS